MTEALITKLGHASPLRVIARTSVNQYQKTRKPVREIANELNVDIVVEGTITQSGDRLRVTANLIQVSPEKHILGALIRSHLQRCTGAAKRDRRRNCRGDPGQAHTATAFAPGTQPSRQPRGAARLLEGALFSGGQKRPGGRPEEY
jgi:hypothetical protein